ALAALRDVEQLAAVDAVGERAGPRGEEQRGRELERRRDADRDARVVRELGQDEPVLGDALHPRTDRGDEGAGHPPAVVAVLEGGKGLGHQLSTILFRTVVARARSSRSAGVSAASWRASQASRRRIVSRTSSRPASVTVTRT